MWARPTRVEINIVSVALLVLLLCSNPPRSGNADVRDFSDQVSEPMGPVEETTPDLDVVSDAPPPDVAMDEATERPPAPRIAAVDARSCNRLDYKDVMYGQVTVRWVWNGTKFVPHKVCVVEEENGVSSVWSFDQQDRAVLSELAEEADAPH